MSTRWIGLFLLCCGLSISGCGSDIGSVNPNPQPIPNLDSPGGKIFKEFCSSCHGLPSPAVHKAEEWPYVIERMQVHRVKNAYLPLTESQKKELINYLQENAEG